jgi:putative ABC transport system permease protein
MTSPRWRKVLADLLGNKTRTVLAILSITVGVFTIGFVSASQAIMLPDMEANFKAANPHSAMVYTEPFDADVVRAVERLPEVGIAEGRPTLTVRLESDSGQKFDLGINGIPPVSQMQIDLLSPIEPAVLPELEEGEIWIENSAVSVFPVKIGESIEVQSPDGQTHRLRVTAIVRDVSMPAAMFGGPLSAFASPATVESLGGPASMTRLLLVVAENGHDEKHVRSVVGTVCDLLRAGGRMGCGSWVYNPGEHYSRQIFVGVMVVLNVLGGMAVFLSMFLVINTVNSLLSQHVRHIGIMKAIGGRSGQIVGMYLVLVASYGLLAFLIAAPLSAAAAYSASSMMAGMVNISLGSFHVVPVAVAAQAAAALLIPLAAAAVPVLTGTRVSVRKAIHDYGMGNGDKGRGLAGRLLQKVKFLSRPLLLSLGNAFRRKGRLILTLSTLILGGAIFISVFNVQDSLHSAVDDLTRYFPADVTVSFSQPVSKAEIEQLVLDLPEVTAVEGWGLAEMELLSEDESDAQPVLIYAPPADSTLIQPLLADGRWLLPEDTNAIVIGPSLLAKRPDLAVSDVVTFRVAGQDTVWEIVGIYEMTGNVSPPLLYTNYEIVEGYLPEIKGLVQMIRVTTIDSDVATERQAAEALEKAFSKANVAVEQVQVKADWLAQQKGAFNVVVYFLLVMAVLIALVGVLGLAGMMSMNVMERTREIGVLRAVGASNGAVLIMVIVEGVTVGLVSWLLALAVSFPLTSALDAGVGQAMFQQAFPYVIGWRGAAIWLVGALALSAVASALPARRAVRLTVRDVLAYE